MSVKKVEMFTVVCDNCGSEIKIESRYSETEDKYLADKSKAENDNWICSHYNDYCEDCYEYDDEDNLVIKTVLHKQRSL